MADSYIQVPPNSTGEKVRTQTKVIGADTVNEHYMIVSDETADSNAPVIATVPAATSDVGLYVKPVPDLSTGGQIGQKVHIVGDGNKFCGGIDAHDAVITGNPVLGGGVGSSGAPTAVTSGRAVRTYHDVNGRIVISGDSGMANVRTQGTKSNNTAAPTSDNISTLPSVAESATPSYTTTREVKLSSTLSGDLRVTLDSEVIALPSGAATSANQSTEITALQLIDDIVAMLGTTTYTEATTKAAVIGAVRRDADTTLVDTTNEVAPLQVDANGRLKVEAFSGETLTVQDLPVTTGGLSKFHLVSAASTNANNVKASAGQVYAITAFNLNAAARYLKFHNTAGTPTAGTGVTDTFMIPGNTAGAGFVINFDKGITFSTGIGITTVTGIADADSAAVAANDLVFQVYFK